MSTRIEAVATSLPHGPFARGALRLSDRAARACLERAGRRPNELDLLVSAAVYKDKAMAEPAIASIIQEDIGANLGHPPRRDRHGTFSFDVLDGGCGVLSAARLVDVFLSPGTARLAMIVAGDADPSPGASHGFPFAPAGGAVLLAHADDGEGFLRFERETFPELASSFEVRLRFEPPHEGAFGRRGRNVLETHEAPEFARRSVDLASDMARRFLRREGLRPHDVDLLVASQYPPSFPADVSRALDVPPDRLPEVRGELASTHTAGPLAALEAAVESGLFARARNVLFLTVGAGVAVVASLYRKPAV